MIRAQRSEDAVTVQPGTVATVLRETGQAESDRIFSYRLGAPSGSSARITLTQRGKFGSERIVQIDVGPGGAGRVRVQGSVQADIALTGPAPEVFYYTTLETGAIEPCPPLDVEETRTGDVGAPGPWSDVGLGYPPPERWQLGLFTTGAADFRLVDGAGAVFGQWSVNGAFNPLIHPPRLKLQARGTTPVATIGLVAVWR